MNRASMWPVRYDMTRDDCRKCLRCLELDAYGSIVSVLRAQGPFTTEKQELLQELAKVLHISSERHRAEVRRAVNDEKLATIAEQLGGPNTGTDWTIEGRRAIPLLPRLKARSAFSTLANSLSVTTAVANERKPIACAKTEDAKDVEMESQLDLKLENKLLDNTETFPAEYKLCDEKIALEEAVEPYKSNDSDNQNGSYEVSEKLAVTRKRKSLSPLPLTPPNKVLLVSSNSLEAMGHGSIEKRSLENSIYSSQAPTNSLQHQNDNVIPLNINCRESTIADSRELVTQENSSHHTFIQSGKYISTVTTVYTTNATKNKGRTTTTQDKLSTKTTPTVLLSGSLTSVSANNVQSDIQHTHAQESLNSKVPVVTHTLQKVTNSENAISSATCTKRVTSIIHSNTNSVTTKSITSNSSQRVMAVCPGTTVSSGPGPPQSKQTTLTCKKLSTSLNHQTTAKMGVTLNSNKTVNISHHPNTKLAPKTNVIVIQKGHTKGVTLSHAGKEVIGKVIMGGKNLCVASQHSGTSISVLPHHIALNNGDQAVTMLSTTNSSHGESVKTSIKPGNTVVFNLRQDVLEKNKVLSQLLESSSVLTSEPKTVIQNTNVCTLKEKTNNDLHIQDKELVVKTDTVITSIKDEKQHRKSKYVYRNTNFHVINSLDPMKFLGSKEILINSRQLMNTQDDTINNIGIGDTVCNSEINVYDTSLGSADIAFENCQYLMEGNETHVFR